MPNCRWIARQVPPVRDLYGLRSADGGALSEERCTVPADHLDSRPQGQPRSQTRGLPIGRHVDRSAGSDVHEDGPVVPALAGGVLVDADRPRSGHFRLGKCVHQPQRSAAAGRRTNDVSQPGSDPARQGEADRRQGRAEPLDPPAVPPGRAGYLLGAGTLRSGRRTGGPAAGVRPFAPHSEHQRETAGKSHDPERSTLRNPGARRLRRCTAHQHALSRCSRRPTAAQRPRSTGTTTPPAGARSRSQCRTVCSADTATTRFRSRCSIDLGEREFEVVDSVG